MSVSKLLELEIITSGPEILSFRCYIENRKQPEIWTFDKFDGYFKFNNSRREFRKDKIEMVDTIVEKNHKKDTKQLKIEILNEYEEYEKQENEREIIIEQIKSHPKARLFFIL
jgi:hypothetical protein